MDKPLRVSLWNFLTVLLWEHWQPIPQSFATSPRSEIANQVEQLGASVWAHYLGRALDRMPPFNGGYDKTVLAEIRTVVIAGAWNEVFDLLEFIVKWSPKDWAQHLQNGYNTALEQESSAYRMTNGHFVAITSQPELQSIDEAIQTSQDAVAEHLTQALSLLTDRVKPDFRNSIKESISAVESLCKEIVGRPNATLGACINEIKQKHHLHGSMEEALKRLYGFTSDAGGIRHGMIDPAENPIHADALFMLVSCSAFVNYLRSVIRT